MGLFNFNTKERKRERKEYDSAYSSEYAKERKRSVRAQARKKAREDARRPIGGTLSTLRSIGGGLMKASESMGSFDSGALSFVGGGSSEGATKARGKRKKKNEGALTPAFLS
jgi:hypothetical protein